MTKSILDYPPQAHLRRARLYEALAVLNFSRTDVDVLIAAGTIQPKHIEHPRRVRATKNKKKSRPKNIPAEPKPPLIKGRGYYVADDVITALKLKRP